MTPRETSNSKTTSENTLSKNHDPWLRSRISCSFEMALDWEHENRAWNRWCSSGFKWQYMQYTCTTSQVCLILGRWSDRWLDWIMDDVTCPRKTYFYEFTRRQGLITISKDRHDAIGRSPSPWLNGWRHRFCVASRASRPCERCRRGPRSSVSRTRHRQFAKVEGTEGVTCFPKMARYFPSTYIQHLCTILYVLRSLSSVLESKIMWYSSLRSHIHNFVQVKKSVIQSCSASLSAPLASSLSLQTWVCPQRHTDCSFEWIGKFCTGETLESYNIVIMTGFGKIRFCTIETCQDKSSRIYLEPQG